MANFIFPGGNAIIDVPANQLLTIGTIGAGQANIYTIANSGPLTSGNDANSKIPFAPMRVLAGTNDYYKFPLNTGDISYYIETLGCTVEWLLGNGDLTSFNSPYTLTRGIGGVGNTTLNTPRGRGTIAAGQSSCTITNNNMQTGTEFVAVTLFSTDATVNSLRVNALAIGQFTVVAIPGPATANCIFDWCITQ